MDRRERMDSLQVVLRTALEGWQGQIWTALPAMVNAYDAAKMTVSAQPTVQARILSSAGKWSSVDLPLCQDCPVVFPSGGGYAITFPIAAGDEGILVFASRCIDAWWQNGKVQPQAEFRLHDLSDGMFIPGLFSQPRKLSPAPDASKVQIRSADGTKLISMGDDIDLSLSGGAISFSLDSILSRVSGVAPNGFWFNGVKRFP